MKRWRFPLIVLSVWVVLTLVAGVLFELSLRYVSGPWLQSLNSHQLNIQGEQFYAELSRWRKKNPDGDLKRRAMMLAEQREIRLVWRDDLSFEHDAEELSKASDADASDLINPTLSDEYPSATSPSAIGTGLQESPATRQPQWMAKTWPGSGLVSVWFAVTDSDVPAFQLHRSHWPVYRRAEFLSFVAVGVFFYAPLLGWFMHRLEGNFAQLSGQALSDLRRQTGVIADATGKKADNEGQEDGEGLSILHAGELGRRLRRGLEHFARREQKASHTARESLRITAHEIRRPLQRLMFAVHGLDETDHPRNTKLKITMEQALEEMSSLVDEALWYARFSHGPLPLQPHHFHLENLVDELVAQQRDLYPGHRFEVEPGAQTPTTFRADRKLLERMIANLLTNAIKYGAGKVKVSWQWTSQQLLLTVHDNGPGIPSQQREQLFEPFATGDHTAPTHPYGGLGLAIVQGICLSHGGEARITDSPLGGAAVIVVLPMSGPVTLRAR